MPAPTLFTVAGEDSFPVGSSGDLVPPSHRQRFESRLQRSTEAL